MLLIFPNRNPLGMVGRSFPFHVGDLIDRTQIDVRIPVTIQTPTHAERLDQHDLFHLRNIAVTTDTPDSGIDVRRVIEVSEVRQVVDSNPFQRLAGSEAVSHQSQFLAFGFDHRVTIHTGSGRGHVGVGLLLDSGMAVAAVDPQVARVDSVAVRHRLFWPVPDIGILR